MSGDASTVIVGSPFHDGNKGHVRIFNLSEVLSTNSSNLSQTSIFPNPASDVININTNNEILKEVLIYNSLGQMVKKSNQIKVDTLNLDKGIYFITIETEQGKSTKKLIIN